MRSIGGFNNSSVMGSFGQGEPVSARALNKLGAGIDNAKTAMSNDVQFQTSTGGTSYSLPQALLQSGSYSPFGVSVFKDGETYKFYCGSGTINGLVPCIGGGVGASNLLTATPAVSATLTFSSEGNCWVYLRAGPKTSGSKVWPDNNFSNAAYPNVIAYNAIQSDSDTYGYILIALVTKDPTTNLTTVNQFLRSSVWSQRNKYTLPDSSIYYFWPI